MTIRPNTWHLRVFLQAYVRDRAWRDGGKIVDDPIVQEKMMEDARKLPETVAYMRLRKKLYEESFGKLREPHETYTRLDELRRASNRAYGEWFRPKAALYTAKKSGETSERLYAGRMSLCPYFWSVVAALFFYYGFARSTRPVRNFLKSDYIQRWALAAIGGVMVITMVGAAGAAIYETYAGFPSVSDIGYAVVRLPVAVKQEVGDAIREQRARAEYDRTLREYQLAWEREHPREAQRDHETAEQEKRIQKAQEWQETKSEIMDIVKAFVVVLCIIGVVALLCWSLGWFLRRFEGRTVEPKPASPFYVWLTRQMQKISAFFEPVRRFSRDTRELVLAFLKAKKEKVCPYLIIEEGRDFRA